MLALHFVVPSVGVNVCAARAAADNAARWAFGFAAQAVFMVRLRFQGFAAPPNRGKQRPHAAFHLTKGLADVFFQGCQNVAGVSVGPVAHLAGRELGIAGASVRLRFGRER